MNFLISTAAAVLAISLAFVSARSTLSPENTSKDETIIFDVPVPEGVKGKQLELEGDRFLVKGKTFSSAQELENLLGEGKQGKSSQDLATPEPFKLVVPVARKFCSLKELTEMLKEFRSKAQNELTDWR